MTQVHHYFSTYTETLPKRLLVLWVWLLSTCQMVIIFWTGWRYFSKGTENLSVWGEFLLPLSFQDALVRGTNGASLIPRYHSWRSLLSYSSDDGHGA